MTRVGKGNFAATASANGCFSFCPQARQEGSAPCAAAGGCRVRLKVGAVCSGQRPARRSRVASIVGRHGGLQAAEPSLLARESFLVVFPWYSWGRAIPRMLRLF
jgi:hypothetical protein